MPKQSEDAGAVLAQVESAVAAASPGAWVLAVSGGRDSMVLMHAFAEVRHGEVRSVATFDHGTGAAATGAAELVVREAGALMLPVRMGRAPAPAAGRPTEAQWRTDRMEFLGSTARALGATVVTAHSRDDQAETVALRIVRGAGPRGLAGMQPGPRISRPLLSVPRATIARYAEIRRVPFVEDPSNADLRHARNRMRLEILPALERAESGFGEWLHSLAARASEWRAGVERFVDDAISNGRITVPGDGTVVVAATPLAGLAAKEWQVLWPAIAARAGVAMDRRGLMRASEWSARVSKREQPGCVQIAGGFVIERNRHAFVLRSAAPRGGRERRDSAAAIY